VKIVTLLKHVPDSMANIKVTADSGGIETDGVKFGPNPFDEFAVEQALQMREGGADAEVVVLCLGPAEATESIRAALAMGADRAVHLCDNAFAGQDALATARCLAAAIDDDVDLVLAGEHAIDDGQSLVPSMVAELLGLVQINSVTALDVSSDSPVRIKATRRIEGGEERVELTGPAVVTCEKGLNEPRYPSLPNLMKAKKKEIRQVGAGDIGVDAGQIGADNSGIRVVKYFLGVKDRRNEMIEGSPDEQAAELVRKLRDEAGVF
jgi:electron transfer flavoprotein beta subunit